MGNYVSDSTRADPHDGKTKVTPESILATLAAQKKQQLYSGYILSGCCLLLSLMILFMLGVGSVTGAWVPFVRALLLLAPFAVLFGFVYTYKRSIKRFKGSDYSIITDTVERVVEDDKMVHSYHGTHSSYHMEHAMYLTHCGRIVISQSETYTNSVGDIFYVVVSKNAPNIPLMLLNSKYYELQTPKQG